MNLPSSVILIWGAGQETLQHVVPTCPNQKIEHVTIELILYGGVHQADCSKSTDI